MGSALSLVLNFIQANYAKLGHEELLFLELASAFCLSVYAFNYLSKGAKEASVKARGRKRR